MTEEPHARKSRKRYRWRDMRAVSMQPGEIWPDLSCVVALTKPTSPEVRISSSNVYISKANTTTLTDHTEVGRVTMRHRRAIGEHTVISI